MKNTVLLYIRMMVVMLINLFAVRFVLKALGIEDYGIYNVVAGVITMLSFLSSVLATATQRYYSHSMGVKDLPRLNNIFSMSINLYIFIALIICLLGETLGLWFINTQLVIPAERMVAVNWVYQFSIFSFIFTIIQIPYSAAVIAHEDMGIFAIISTAESILKFGCALLLLIIPSNRFVIYGATLLLVCVIIFVAYFVVGHNKYAECRYKKLKEKKLYNELLSFSGWTLFGSVASIGINQINTILVNIFFGPMVNASRAISMQIDSAVSSFSNSFITAIKPPMIKSYAADDYSYVYKVFNISNKLGFYCLLIVCLPLLFEMNIILSLWLNMSEPQMVLFSRLILVYSLIMALNNPISIIIQATGHIKEYNISVEIFTLLCAPITYILFKMGCPAYVTFIVMIVAAIASHIMRLVCLKKFFPPFSYSEYLKSFILPALVITLISSVVIYFVSEGLDRSIVRLFISICCSLLSVSVLTYLVGLSSYERLFFNHYIFNIMIKLKGVRNRI
ncbi:MAG: polysaccharide biosynthesis protein [Bacteroidales bacterium]